MTQPTWRVADLFCGAGGLSYGLDTRSDTALIFATDSDKDAIASYKATHPCTQTILSDIKELTAQQLEQFKPIDIVIGGAPCQSYSTLGKRKLDDRAYLFKEYLRVVDILKPRMILFENVKGLLSMQKKALLKEIIMKIEQLGYHTYFKVLNAVDFGVPQQRERLFIVGIHYLSFIGAFEFPKPTSHTSNTLAHALSDLPSIKAGESSHTYKSPPQNPYQQWLRNENPPLSEHIAPNANPQLIKIMETLKDGEDKYALPDDIRPKTGYTNTYAKLWWNRPSITIPRNFSTPSSSRCIHPIDSRALTIREGARLQSFPDDYEFHGTPTSKRIQIGNAVPPLLAKAITGTMVDYLNRRYELDKSNKE